MEPVRLHGNNDPFLPDGEPNEVKGRFVVALLSVSLRPVDSVLPSPQSDKLRLGAEAEKSRESESSAPPQDPIRVQSVLRGFLLLSKQLQLFQESWAQRRLGVQMFGTPQQTVVKLYRYSGTHLDCFNSCSLFKVSLLASQSGNLLPQHEGSGSTNRKGAGLRDDRLWLPVPPAATRSLGGRRERLAGAVHQLTP